MMLRCHRSKRERGCRTRWAHRRRARRDTEGPGASARWERGPTTWTRRMPCRRGPARTSRRFLSSKSFGSGRSWRQLLFLDLRLTLLALPVSLSLALSPSASATLAPSALVLLPPPHVHTSSLFVRCCGKAPSRTGARLRTRTHARRSQRTNAEEQEDKEGKRGCWHSGRRQAQVRGGEEPGAEALAARGAKLPVLPAAGLPGAVSAALAVREMRKMAMTVASAAARTLPPNRTMTMRAARGGSRRARRRKRRKSASRHCRC